ncbi:UNVERIFIED_CONTAM: hypothetical protein HDU68_000713 [Siphonaria sp. JEL0065]|nr:hypothetical protein HDU68_000713 [Siphonaria sp. JEL0065]
MIQQPKQAIGFRKIKLSVDAIIDLWKGRASRKSIEIDADLCQDSSKCPFASGSTYNPHTFADQTSTSKIDHVLVKDAWNKALPWVAMLGESLVIPRGPFFPAIQKYLVAIIDIAVRALNPFTEVIAREAYGPISQKPHQRYTTFEGLALFFCAIGFDIRVWSMAKESFCWAISQTPLLEDLERQDAMTPDGALSRFFQNAIVERVLAVNDGVLLNVKEVSQLQAKLPLQKRDQESLRTKFSQSFCKAFPGLNAKELSLLYLDAIETVLNTANVFDNTERLYRIGELLSSKSFASTFYPQANKLFIKTLSSFIRFTPSLEAIVLKLINHSTLLLMQPQVRNEELLREASEWLHQCGDELKWSESKLKSRLAEVKTSILESKTYSHSSEEIEYGAQVAWRNSSKCVGRIAWSTLKVIDKRHVTAASDMFLECENHLRIATAKPNMEAVMTVFAPRKPDERWGPRFWNAQLVRFAGYEQSDGTVLGDPANKDLTARIIKLGWIPPAPRTAFDPLPVVLELPGQAPVMHELSKDSVICVNIEHPTNINFKDLNLKWCAVPAITGFNMSLGGIDYVCCPFNGWFMETEITRNLWERYQVGAEMAGLFGLDTSDLYWKDIAFVELSKAVLHSFQKAKLSMVDHISSCSQFRTHIERERESGREVPAQWSWVVPSMGGALNSLWHREMREFTMYPQYEYCAERFHFQGVGRTVELEEAELETKPHLPPSHDLEETGDIAQQKLYRILIMYGSETGTCQNYAIRLSRMLAPYVPNVMTINAAVESNSLAKQDAIIVVTSTFGAGSAPSNASKLSSEALASIDEETKFAVFAAGSTVYPDFCLFGKTVFGMFKDKGAKQICGLVFGNDLKGQTAEFEAFSRKVVGVLDPSLLETQPTGNAMFKVVVLETSTAAIQLPSEFHLVPVIDNHELLREGSSKSVRELFFNLEDANTSLKYETGDHVKVWPLNNSEAVRKLCDLLDINKNAIVDVLDVQTNDRALLPFKLPATVADILGAYLDLNLRSRMLPAFLDVMCRAADSNISRETIRIMIEHVASENDEVGLKTMDLIDRYITVYGFLQAFPSIKVTLAHLLEVLLPQKPRHYSISSSNKSTRNQQLSITVAIVEDSLSSNLARPGVCSSYLQRLVPHRDSAWIAISKSSFRMPVESDAPILMVAPGTGISPMYGFLKEKAHTSSSGPATLYSGSRNRNDLIYGKELREYLSSGVLDGFYAAHSRNGGKKEYVQDLIQVNASHIANMFADPKLHYYVCGDAQMADDVENTITRILIEKNNWLERVAIEFVDQMKREGRWQSDTWGISKSRQKLEK